MEWQYSPYTVALMAVGIGTAAFGLLIWRSRRMIEGRFLALLMLSVSEWSLAYAAELASANLEAKIFWARIAYVGILSVPAFWVLLLLQYAGKEEWLTPRRMSLLAIQPAVMLLLVWTNDAHRLVWTGSTLRMVGTFATLVNDFGVGFRTHEIYCYSLFFLGILLIVDVFIRSPRLYRKQAGILLVASIAPFVANVIYLFGAGPFRYLDFTPLAFTITCLAFAWGLSRFGLLDIVPIARDAIIESMRDPLIVLNADDRILDMNPAAERLLGCAAGKAVGQPVRQVWPQWPEGFESHDEDGPAGGGIIVSGKTNGRIYEMHISYKRNASGLPACKVIVGQDVTERKRAEEALREGERRYRKLAETATDVIWTLDLKSLRFTFVSPSVLRLRGYTVEEAMTHTLDQVLTPLSFELGMSVLAEELAVEERAQDSSTRSRALELEQTRKDGTTVWTEVTITFVRDADGLPVEILGITRDITARHLKMEALLAISLVDELTGLHNRRAFLTLGGQQLKLAYRTKRSMAVLFIDLDNMKLINDTFGHDEGDCALKEIANVLRESFRESDLIARIGGDEFAIMALEVPSDSAEILIARLRQKIEAHNAAMGKPYHLSISVGVARYAPECPRPIEDLLSRADASMYEEKNKKKTLGQTQFLKTSQ